MKIYSYVRRAVMLFIKHIEKEAQIKVSRLFKTISDPTRIKIIYMLKNQELNVSKIVEALNMEQSAVSHQLKVLRDINLFPSFFRRYEF